MSLSPAVRLSALSAAAFAAVGVQAPFLPVWLQGQGLDATTIGIILALPICVRAVASAPLVGLADTPRVTARALLTGAHLALAAAFALLLVAPGPLAIGLVVVLAALAQSPITPGTDLVLTDAVREKPSLDYGRLRLFGSVSFLVTSVAMGYVLEIGPLDAIVWALVGFSLAGGLVSLGTPTPAGDLRQSSGGAPRARLPAALVLALAAAALVQSSHAGIYAFGSIHWKSLGFSGSTVGWLWAVGVVTEIVLFYALGRSVGRSSGIGLIALGAATGVVRHIGLALATTPLAVFALQSLHAFSFAATHLGAMAVLTALAPPGARGRAQGWLAGGQALAMAGATVLGGFVYEHGGALVFAAMAPLALAGLVLSRLAQTRRALTRS